METRTILCVEDDLASQQVLTGMLEELGYNVLPAYSAQQALQTLAEPGIDGVLLEYDLPDENGASVRSYIKTLWPDIPILMFAGVGTQTPFMVSFFDAYLRNAELPSADPLQDLIGCDSPLHKENEFQKDEIQKED